MEGKNQKDQPGPDGPPINMTILLTNTYQEPFFNFKQELKNWPQNKLIYALEAAADVNQHFRFSAKYFGEMGYMITVLNGLSMSDEQKTYWAISSDKTGHLNVGVSTYVPQNNEVINFDFKSYAKADPCPAK